VILVLVEPEETSREAITFARQLGERVETVVFGEAGGLGVERAYAVDLGDYAPHAWAETVVQLVGEKQPEVVVASGTDRGNEVLAHVAAELELPLAVNCTELVSAEPFVVTRIRWGGSLLEEAELDAPVKLLTVAPHAVAAEEAPVETEVVPFAPSLSEHAFRVRVTDRVEPEPGAISLSDARVVVGGGRGMGSAEAFEALEELARLLGGAVGCSRAVTSLGWRPHTDQIGQTGTRIAPDLYIACAISGAIQHMVGCKAAKRIMVINKDPQAPILAQADYAAIGDVNEIVPAVNEALKLGATRQAGG
jgi:electron transfer flavoprotein alpha subunit